MKYETATVTELNKALISGEVTPIDLLNECKRVIKEKDVDIKAFIELFDTAEEDAKRAHEMIKNGKSGILTGIPIAIKDNICIEDKKVSAGSKMLENFVSPYDASVISKLKKAGAILVGRTNMDEFAMGSSTENSYYGVTRNPINKEKVSGGSSGGSAAAVCMGAVPLALGSDTGGSVRQPASFCGVVGLKPTYGSVSRHGLIALGSSLDVIGIFSRCTNDAKILYEVISGDDAYDNTSSLFGGETFKQKDKIIGIPNLDELDVEEETKKCFLETIDKLKQKGYITRNISIPIMKKAVSIYYIIQPAEASSNLSRFDGVRYGLHIPGDDLWGDYINTRDGGFGEEVTRRIIVGTYVLSVGYYDAYYVRAVEARNKLREEFNNVLNDVQLILLPTVPGVAFNVGELKDPVEIYAEDRLTVQANLTGLPSISIPMKTDGLPKGIQCISSYNNEDAIFECAKCIED